MKIEMRVVCEKAAYEAEVAKQNVDNCIAILSFEIPHKEGEERRTAEAQKEVLEDASDVLGRAIRFINQAKEIG